MDTRGEGDVKLFVLNVVLPRDICIYFSRYMILLITVQFIILDSMKT